MQQRQRTSTPRFTLTKYPRLYNRLSGGTIAKCPFCGNDFTITRGGVRSPGVDLSHYIQHITLDQMCQKTQAQQNVGEVLASLPENFRKEVSNIVITRQKKQARASYSWKLSTRQCFTVLILALLSFFSTFHLVHHPQLFILKSYFFNISKLLY